MVRAKHGGWAVWTTPPNPSKRATIEQIIHDLPYNQCCILLSSLNINGYTPIIISGTGTFGWHALQNLEAIR